MVEFNEVQPGSVGVGQLLPVVSFSLEQLSKIELPFGSALPHRRTVSLSISPATMPTVMDGLAHASILCDVAWSRAGQVLDVSG